MNCDTIVKINDAFQFIEAMFIMGGLSFTFVPLPTLLLSSPLLFTSPLCFPELTLFAMACIKAGIVTLVSGFVLIFCDVLLLTHDPYPTSQECILRGCKEC